jgi:hypothetical protein
MLYIKNQYSTTLFTCLQFMHTFSMFFKSFIHRGIQQQKTVHKNSTHNLYALGDITLFGWVSVKLLQYLQKVNIEFILELVFT